MALLGASALATRLSFIRSVVLRLRFNRGICHLEIFFARSQFQYNMLALRLLTIRYPFFQPFHALMLGD